MDRDLYKLWCLLGIAAALAVFFPLGAKRRACISPIWGRFRCVFAVVALYGPTGPHVDRTAPLEPNAGLSGPPHASLCSPIDHYFTRP